MDDLRTEWQYDEFRQVGTDYGSLEEVEDYDRRMSCLRDVASETEAILGMLDLRPQKHQALTYQGYQGGRSCKT